MGWRSGPTAGKSHNRSMLGAPCVGWNLESRFQANPGRRRNSRELRLERGFFLIRPLSWVNSPTDSAKALFFYSAAMSLKTALGQSRRSSVRSMMRMCSWMAASTYFACSSFAWKVHDRTVWG